MSWAGKILRVNLTAGTVKSEPLNMDWARDYIGSRGLGTKYLVEEVDANGVTNLWARHGSGRPLVCLAGHTDVVPTGPLDKWHTDPFLPADRADMLSEVGDMDG